MNDAEKQDMMQRRIERIVQFIPQLKLEDILAVVPQLAEKMKTMRQYVESEYVKSRGMSKEDCMATGKMWDGVPVDMRVMEVMKMIQVHYDGFALNPKWLTIIEVSINLKWGTRDQRRAIKRKLEKLNASTPLIDPQNLAEPQ